MKVLANKNDCNQVFVVFFFFILGSARSLIIFTLGPEKSAVGNSLMNITMLCFHVQGDSTQILQQR